MNKRKPLNIKTKIFIYINIAILFMLILLWGLNLIFVNTSYRYFSQKKATKAARILTENINEDAADLDKLVDQMALAHLLNIAIVSPEGEKVSGYNVYANTDVAVAEELGHFYEEALNADGYYETLKATTFELPADLQKRVRGSKRIERKVLTQVYIVKKANGEKNAIITECLVNIPPHIYNAFLVEIGFFTVFIVINSFILSWIIGRAVAVPLIDLNMSAKYMTSGGDKIAFSGVGYKEIIELSETLNFAKEEIEATEHYRQELVANISHDLRTPLALIKGYTEMMRDFPNEASTSNLQVVIDETNRLTMLVEDMLNLTKLDTREYVLNLEVFDLIEELESLYAHHSKLIEGLGFEIIFEKTDERAMVNADKIKISQVLYNLINNAMTYAGDDKKIIIKQSSSKEFYKIEVIDHGEGIDVDILPKIWDRYFKSEKTHKRGSLGSGIGLSIVKKIMTLHPGGLYGVITTVGEGSNFYIELPRWMGDIRIKK